MRDCGTQDANEHGDGEITVTAPDQGLGTSSTLESVEGEEADQVLRNGTTPHQIVPEGTWVWGKDVVVYYIMCNFINKNKSLVTKNIFKKYRYRKDIINIALHDVFCYFINYS